MTVEQDTVELNPENIDIASTISKIIRERDLSQYGAMMTFAGIVCGSDSYEKQLMGQTVRGIEYETYNDLFIGETKNIIDKVRRVFCHSLGPVYISHRLDTVPVGCVTSVIIVLAHRRKEAAQALEMIIDGMKEKVPLWKKVKLSEREDRIIKPASNMR